tara:strand:+ start:282 stop:815 length:534 start_codon:yes stop_codon:yes gene_type:complete
MRRSFIIVFLLFIGILFVALSYGADNRTTVNNKNTPPPSAVSPSIQSYSQMICSFPVVGAVSTSVVGISSGTTFTDWNCERRMLSSLLIKNNLVVAGIGVLCGGSKEVWSAMLHAGTPCSIWNGQKALIGKEAIAYYKKKGYIDDKGNILRYPDYVGANNVSNFSKSKRKPNDKYPY